MFQKLALIILLLVRLFFEELAVPVINTNIFSHSKNLPFYIDNGLGN